MRTPFHRDHGANTGTAGTGSSALEYGSLYERQTILTVNATLPAITGGVAQGLGVLLYTFPTGLAVIKNAALNLAVTQSEGNITSDTPDTGLGSVVATGAVSTLDGTGTFEDILEGQTLSDCNGTQLKVSVSLVAGALDALYFNVADTWAAGGDVGASVTGTVVLNWVFADLTTDSDLIDAGGLGDSGHDAVTLAGLNTYLTLSGQQITRGDIPVSALADGTDGELITWDASGVPATVSVGTATHVLTSNGAGAAPTFQASSGGGSSLSWTAVGTPDQNQTGVVDEMAAWDISSLTADRDFILPDTASVDDLIGVYITTGDATYEVNIKTAAVGSLLNGVDASSGLGHWKLFITNEFVKFRCIKAGGAGDTDWVIEEDGRIPCNVSAELSSDITTNTADTPTACDMDTENTDVGDVYDNSSNYRMVCRRDANWSIVLSCRSYAAITDGAYYIAVLYDGNPGNIRKYASFTSAASSNNLTPVMTVNSLPLSDGDICKPYFRPSEGNKGLSSNAATYFEGLEILKR
jgi:hypothetical protein